MPDALPRRPTSAWGSRRTELSSDALAQRGMPGLWGVSRAHGRLGGRGRREAGRPGRGRGPTRPPVPHPAQPAVPCTSLVLGFCLRSSAHGRGKTG